MESPLDPAPGCSNTTNNMGSLYETEGGRGCRNKRRQSNPTFCPVCKCTLRPSDVDQHLNCELEKLQKISKFRMNRSSTAGPLPGTSSGNGYTSSSSSSGQSIPAPAEHYRKYVQVRSNRQSRQKAKCKRRKLNDGSSTAGNFGNFAIPGPSNITDMLNVDESSHADLQCPVCNRSKIRTEITMHVERCLARSERRCKRNNGGTVADASADTTQVDLATPSTSRARNGDEDSSPDDSTTDYEGADADNDEIDVEGYEEYEWAGQSRVRVTSMISGGIATLIAAANVVRAASNGNNSTSHHEDVDEDLVVDDDDRFGQPQYSEADMIQCGNSRERREETLRRAVLSPIVPIHASQYTLCTIRSKSAEPARADVSVDRIEAESLQNRAHSDAIPDPHYYSDTDRNGDNIGSMVKPEEAPLSVGYTHPSRPLAVSITPPPPILTPIDTSVLPRPTYSNHGSETPIDTSVLPRPTYSNHGSESSRSSSPIPDRTPATTFIEHRSVDEPTSATSASDSEPHLLLSNESNDGIPPQSSYNGSVSLQPMVAPNSVPRLSTIAQNVASRSHVTGANPASGTSTVGNEPPINQLVIESLFARIRELEARLEGDIFKCLICMDRYRKPLISICCWHVHCEECWLRTLGAKKLCPQCNAITTPRDLRKIYI